MDLGLAGKTALVTGGSKGIGRAIALALAAEGVHLHLAARGEKALAEARDAVMGARQVSATLHPCDLSESAAQRALAEAAGGVDILVNNAGAIPGGPLSAIDETRWRAAWDLKLFGYVNLCREFHARMSARGSGVIVNVIGLAGERLDANYIAGSTANAGLMAFTRALGSTSLDDGVRVAGVNPGYVETGRMVTLMRARAADTLGDADRWRELTKGLPLGRAATPEEVADLAVFLASPRASYISGVVYALDGGFAARAG